MTKLRLGLKVRVGETMEILDGIRSEGITNIVSSAGKGDFSNSDVECLYYSLENLGERISLTGVSFDELERDYEVIRKNLLSLVTCMARIAASVKAPNTSEGLFDYAIRA
jgi:hypothetical protein